METIAGFPYCRIQFDKQGQRFAAADLHPLVQELVATQPTDLIVISHGWNNDMEEAHDLYTRYFTNVAALISNHSVELPGRKLAVLGIFWPSKKFAEESLIPSGAASLAGSQEASLRQSIDTLRDLLQDPVANAKLDRAADLVAELSANEDAREQFAQCVIDVLPTSSPEATEDGAEFLRDLSGSEIMNRLRVLPASPMGGTQGGAAVLADAEDGAADHGPIVGGANGIGHLFDSVTSAAQQLLNYTTYYVMKERAGVVGELGVAPTLQAIADKLPHLAFHLVGHSFGGRVVTAAAMATKGDPPTQLRSMLLLQAAFSHNGFAPDLGGSRTGFFRDVIARNRVAGPIMVTHSRNDRAVGLAYAIASRVAQDDSNAVGDANDRYGGIGSNGAQKTPEHVNATLANVNFQFSAGHIYNLRADAVIGGHSEVDILPTARVLLEAIKAAG